MAEPVLQFEHADLRPDGKLGSVLLDVTLMLNAGESAVVGASFSSDPANDLGDYFPLADAAQGMLPCDKGRILFRGREWSAMPPLEQARCRGLIGRIFDFQGWIFNLEILENILLACRIYPERAVPNVEAEALRLARRFGLDGIPPGRPALAGRRDLRRLEWVRAFLGKPELVILEHPEMDMVSGALDALFETAREAQRRGTALLWITHDREIQERVLRLGGASFEIRNRTWRRRGETET
jgi:phospholipid/cholesterol/gamma-HCH transport system ATP-binding protein